MIISNFLVKACGYSQANTADLINNHISNPTRRKKLEQKEYISQRHTKVQ